MTDWFRKSRWTAHDAEDFECRLKRARAHSRPQYLFIQATHLLESGDPTLVQAANELATRVTRDFDPCIHTSAAHDLRGQCLEVLGRPSDALEAYRQAVLSERETRGIQTDAYLRFAWLVATRNIHDSRDDALRYLDEFGSRPAFPVQRFVHFAARALLSLSNDRPQEAAADAQRALFAARELRSGFRHHQSLGLVGDRYEDVQRRLRDIAAG